MTTPKHSNTRIEASEKSRGFPATVFLLLVAGIVTLGITQGFKDPRFENAGIQDLVPANSEFATADYESDVVDSGGLRTEANSGTISFQDDESTSLTATASQPEEANQRVIRTAGDANKDESDTVENQ